MTDSFYVEDSGGGGKDFIPVPPGLHLGRCYRIVDLGTQRTEYMGEEKLQRKVMIGWELHGEAADGSPLKTEKGDPMAIFKNYTFSWADKANLRLDLQSWRGEPWSDDEAKKFDLTTILDRWCMLNVVHREGKTGKMFANVGGISPVPRVIKQHGMPKGVNKVQLFRIADPDMTLFENFGKGLKTKIESSPEWRARRVSKAPQAPQANQAPKQASSGFDDMDDDVPF
jgi:hypothetical protein